MNGKVDDERKKERFRQKQDKRNFPDYQRSKQEKTDSRYVGFSNPSVILIKLITNNCGACIPVKKYSYAFLTIF